MTARPRHRTPLRQPRDNSHGKTMNTDAKETAE